MVSAIRGTGYEHVRQRSRDNIYVSHPPEKTYLILDDQRDFKENVCPLISRLLHVMFDVRIPAGEGEQSREIQHVVKCVN